MSRSPKRNDYLPPIKSIHDEDYATPRGQYISYQNTAGNDRINEYESRLEAQERATKLLFESAMKIKEDMMENLNFTQGARIEEKESRELIQEHVRTITSVMRQMNKDIQNLGSQLKEKENHISGTGNIVRQIETNQASSIGDLRGRVGRCDSSIAKLASDVRILGDSMKVGAVATQDAQNKIIERLQSIDMKNQDINNRIERLNSESSSNIRSSVDDTNKLLVELDNRTKHALDEMNHQIRNIHLQDQSELEKLETRILTNSDKSLSAFSSRMEKLEDAINSDRHHTVILERLVNFENDYKNFRKDRVTFEKELEKRLTAHSDRLYRQQIEDLSRFKREIRDGFAAIHETINNMKSVVEGKQRLGEESMRKEMAQLRKMVVLDRKSTRLNSSH